MDLGQGETETEDPEFLEALRDSGVVAGGDRRVRVLFERCLIACALYEEFWTKVKGDCRCCTEIRDLSSLTRGRCSNGRRPHL